MTMTKFTYQLAYPLRWPEGRPRCQNRRRGRFETSAINSRDDMMDELRRMDATGVVLTCNMTIARGGGTWTAIGSAGIDPGVAVWFERKGKKIAMAVDVFDHVDANMRALGLALKSMRDMERYGATELLDQAFTGFTALPPAMKDRPWFDILGVKRDAPAEVVKGAYLEAAKRYHPDTGQEPSSEVMQLVNRAHDDFRKERGL